MPTNNHRRSLQDQRFWDQAFLLAFPLCMKHSKRGPLYCAHLAREQADAALAERRASRNGESK